jgi:membrane protease YdiL (CAAX protease family)
MQENQYSGPSRWLGLTSNVVSLFGFFLLGAFFGQFFGLFAAVFILELPKVNTMQFQNQLLDFISHPQNYANAFRGMMAVQWFSALFTFVLAPWAYLHFVEKRSISELNYGETPRFQIFVWAVLTVLVSMPFMEYVIQWNQSIVLPAGFEELEKWMKSSEANLAQLTKFLVNFKSETDFAIGILVIAGIAALGEEIFFRGVLQSIFLRYLGNKHVAVWLAAAIFSFIHFQFYGFFPRMFLGAFFGYLYVWYGSIWVPILAHFFNNAWTLTMFYMYQEKNISINPEDLVSEIPWWSAAFSVLLMGFYIRRLYLIRTEL